jgi:hypothetical protein
MRYKPCVPYKMLTGRTPISPLPLGEGGVEAGRALAGPMLPDAEVKSAVSILRRIPLTNRSQAPMLSYRVKGLLDGGATTVLRRMP